MKAREWKKSIKLLDMFQKMFNLNLSEKIMYLRVSMGIYVYMLIYL